MDILITLTFIVIVIAGLHLLQGFSESVERNLIDELCDIYENEDLTVEEQIKQVEELKKEYLNK